jgi:hypothetical protein
MRSGTLCIAQLGLRSVAVLEFRMRSFLGVPASSVPSGDSSIPAVLEFRIIMPSSEKPTVWVGGFFGYGGSHSPYPLEKRRNGSIGQTYAKPLWTACMVTWEFT